MSQRVCIIQPVMKQYRLPFFVGLEKELAKSDIQLQVVYGMPWAEEEKRGDNAELPAPLGCSVPTYRLFRKLFIQPSFLPWVRADLVVLEPANKHLLNYLLMSLYGLGVKRIAYWGHGYDRQSSPTTSGNRFKRKSLHWATWWFAYTRGAAEYITAEGFGEDQVTIVENAVDTAEFRQQLANVKTTDIYQALADLGWDNQDRIGVFCGSLYTNKKLDFLFEAAQLIHQENSKFRLLILGGGPLEDDVRDFSLNHDWVQYVGPMFGHNKATLLKLSDLWLNPGLIGLGILDGFCAGLPVITTDVTFHSPEIEYLEHDINGLMVSTDINSYATAVSNLLNDDEVYQNLKQGALAAAERYNIEKMISNFAEGVKQCLNAS
jgi:L-malate glycosyltransferase